MRQPQILRRHRGSDARALQSRSDADVAAPRARRPRNGLAAAAAQANALSAAHGRPWWREVALPSLRHQHPLAGPDAAS